MKISIIGAAGTLGSCTAFNIGIHGLADEIVMIDTRQNILMQHVLDIQTAMTGRDIVVRAGDHEDLPGSSFVIVTAGTGPSKGAKSSRLDVLGSNLPIITDIGGTIKRFCPQAVVISTTVPVGPLNYAMHLSTGIDRERLLGYTLNDSLRFRMWVAEAIGVSSSQVEGTVIGEHGDSQVLLFSSLRAGGKPVSISQESKHSIRQKPRSYLMEQMALKAGRTTGWTTAVGLTLMVRAIAKNTREMVPCSVVLDGEYGARGLSMTVPAILGQGGVHDILEWELASDEQELLERSINVLKTATQYVKETLGKSC